ncbi:MAG: hypothetical protein V1906_02275, partial [Candidatus Woesearchaeota archaeon]
TNIYIDFPCIVFRRSNFRPYYHGFNLRELSGAYLSNCGTKLEYEYSRQDGTLGIVHARTKFLERVATFEYDYNYSQFNIVAPAEDPHFKATLDSRLPCPYGVLNELLLSRWKPERVNLPGCIDGIALPLHDILITSNIADVMGAVTEQLGWIQRTKSKLEKILLKK